MRLSLFSQDVTVYHRGAGAKDKYNDPTKAETAAGPFRGLLQQTDSTEVVTGGEVVVSDWLLFLVPAAAGAIGAADRVVVDGSSYEVVGNPVVLKMRRRVHHVEARLRAGAMPAA